jgi:hypothetical protein
LAGVDLISRDIKNAEERSYVINVINTTPALLIHYEVQNQGKMQPLVNEIMKIMFAMKKNEACHRKGTKLGGGEC